MSVDVTTIRADSKLIDESYGRYCRRAQDERAGGWFSFGEEKAFNALAALVLTGVTEPTVALIASRATVSVRTVRRMFCRAEAGATCRPTTTAPPAGEVQRGLLRITPVFVRVESAVEAETPAGKRIFRRTRPAGRQSANHYSLLSIPAGPVVPKVKTRRPPPCQTGRPSYKQEDREAQRWVLDATRNGSPLLELARQRFIQRQQALRMLR